MIRMDMDVTRANRANKWHIDATVQSQNGYIHVYHIMIYHVDDRIISCIYAVYFCNHLSHAKTYFLIFSWVDFVDL